MGTLDLTDAVDRVRLAVGDYQDIEIFSDSVYEYVLDKNNHNEPASIREMASLILGALSQTSSRQRLDRLEVYQDSFAQYLTFIKEVIKNPTGNYSTPYIYAAGVDVADVLANQSDATVVQKRLPIGGEEGQYTVLTNEYFETF